MCIVIYLHRYTTCYLGLSRCLGPREYLYSFIHSLHVSTPDYLLAHTLQVFDNGLLGEGALHILAAAQAQAHRGGLLHPSALIIPAAARVRSLFPAYENHLFAIPCYATPPFPDMEIPLHPILLFKKTNVELKVP